MALERILEPEVMDSREEAEQYNDMDHSEVNRCFVEDLLAFATSLQTSNSDLDLGDVLDLGTGTALIPIELCRQSKSCRVMAIDLATSMLDLAVYNIETRGMAQRITLVQADAKYLGFDDETFDVAMSNSIVHHIPEPRGCLEQIVRVTRKGGIIFVRDLKRPDDLETLEKLVDSYAREETEFSRNLFRNSLHAALSLAEIQQKVDEIGFDPETVQATSDRHWTWTAQKAD